MRCRCNNQRFGAPGRGSWMRATLAWLLRPGVQRLLSLLLIGLLALSLCSVNMNTVLPKAMITQQTLPFLSEEMAAQVRPMILLEEGRSC